MRAQRVYSEDDHARVYLSLTINDNNIKRTARETGIPIGTIRTWHDKWEQDGVPENIKTVATEEATNFVTDMERVRGAAILVLESKLSTAKGSELAVIVGILDDKITRARGLATSRHVTQVELPNPDDLRKALTQAMGGAMAAARERADVIDAEVVEPKAITAGSG